MSNNDITAEQVDGWLHRLKISWSPILLEANSRDGRVLYQLVRRGIAEVVSRFVAWSPDSNFEVWIEGTATGRWTKVNAGSLVKGLFPEGQRIGIYQHHFTSARLSPSPTFAMPEGDLKDTICPGKPFALTGEIVLQLLPVDRDVKFAESYKRVPRIAIFYSRAMFSDGTRKPVPTDSILRMEMVQGACPSGGILAWNVAEFEPLEGVQEHFANSAAVSFAFTQASFACSGIMRELIDKGRKGEIPEKGNEDFEGRLGDACARFHHAGRYVVAMYKRHDRDPSYVAAMVANPLSVRNVDHGLLDEIASVAAMDSILGSPPKLPSPHGAPANSLVGVSAHMKNGSPTDTGYAEILKMIRYMGRAFETTPDTYAKFSEEELRDHILTYLSGHFQSGASSERFRKHGRTDLCIAFSNGEAFVSECKIWGGPSECEQALDQLMSYATPRDRAGALVFFNKSVKNFTNSVIKVSEDVLRANRLYLAHHGMTEFGEHHFEIRHKDDCDRRYHLYVLLFNLYPNPRAISQKSREVLGKARTAGRRSKRTDA